MDIEGPLGDVPFAQHEIDTEGVIRSVNQAECRLLGYTEEELIGRHIWEFIAAEHQAIARESIARKVTREQSLTVVNREYRRADGTYIWLEIHERLIENPHGKVIGIRSALLDITERYNFDAEMQRQLAWMRSVLRSMGTAIVTSDALGNVNYMNPAAENLTGWRVQESTGRALEAVCPILHDRGEPVNLVSCLLAEGVPSNRMRRFTIADRAGVSHDVQWNIAPICNDEGSIKGAVLVIERMR
jgi:PAS domain S-box-containing protein